MTKTLFWLRSSAAAALVLTSSSCYYDAYGRGGYGAPGGGGDYGPGGGGGYSNGGNYSGGSGYSGGDYDNGGYSDAGYVDDGGYGGGGYADVSLASGGSSFIYTSSDQWLFDPLVFCYYDRYRSCYYDPYLGGYYPAGYCPRPIYGAPYPGGWRPGHGLCPPPGGFRDRYLANYRNRLDLLRDRHYAWAGSVRERNQGNLASWQSDRVRAAQRFQGNRGQIQQRNQELQARNQANFQNLRGRVQQNQEINPNRFAQNQQAARSRQQVWAQQFQNRPQNGNESAANLIRQQQIRERISAGQAVQASRPQFSRGPVMPQQGRTQVISQPRVIPQPQGRPSFAPAQGHTPGTRPQIQAPPQAVRQPAAGGRGGADRGDRR